MRKERGSASLIGVLLALALIMVMLSIAVPSAIKQIQVTNENAAAVQLAQIGAAETAAQTLYGQYMTLDKMSGTIATPNSCVNPNLLSGAQAQAPSGYELDVQTFAGAPASPASGCVGGFATYVLQMKPTSPLGGQRWFAMAEDGVVHFAPGQSAMEFVRTNTAVYPVSVISQNVSKFIQVAASTTQPSNTLALSTLSGGANNGNRFSWFNGDGQPQLYWPLTGNGAPSVDPIGSTTSFTVPQVALLFSVTMQNIESNTIVEIINVSLFDADSPMTKMEGSTNGMPPTYPNQYNSAWFSIGPQSVPGSTTVSIPIGPNFQGFLVNPGDRLSVDISCYRPGSPGAGCALENLSWKVAFLSVPASGQL